MANHLHKQIRDAVKTKLIGLTTTTTHAYANRLQPLADANLPALRIFLDDETAEQITMHAPALQERTLGLVVEACAKAVIGLDDALDQISMEVETALATGLTIGSTTLPIRYTGMRFDDELADKPIGVKRMAFSITYTAMNNAPDVLT